MTSFNAAFWKWFGDSVVRNPDGSPMVMYHKTYSQFTEFSHAKRGKNDYGYGGAGFYFSPIPLQGYTYGDRTMPVYLSIQNPYIRTKKNWKTDPFNPYLWIPANLAVLRSREAVANAWTEMAIETGYDGFIDLAVDGGEIVAFHPTQIKSVYNAGTWDPRDPDIRRNPPWPSLGWVKYELRTGYGARYHGDVIGAAIVGSVAKGTAKAGSDLDIAVIVPPKRGKTSVRFSAEFHSKYRNENEKPQWEGMPVDFQFFYPGELEASGYAMIPLEGRR